MPAYDVISELRAQMSAKNTYIYIAALLLVTGISTTWAAFRRQEFGSTKCRWDTVLHCVFNFKVVTGSNIFGLRCDAMNFNRKAPATVRGCIIVVRDQSVIAFRHLYCNEENVCMRFK